LSQSAPARSHSDKPRTQRIVGTAYFDRVEEVDTAAGSVGGKPNCDSPVRRNFVIRYMADIEVNVVLIWKFPNDSDPFLRWRANHGQSISTPPETEGASTSKSS